MSGGFAGMLLTAPVDTEILPTSEAEQLRQLIQAKDFISSNIVSASSQPDRLHYKIIAEDDDRHYTVRVSESVICKQLDWLTEIARSQ